MRVDPLLLARQVRLIEAASFGRKDETTIDGLTDMLHDIIYALSADGRVELEYAEPEG